jgi:hypothetical protein
VTGAWKDLVEHAEAYLASIEIESELDAALDKK